MRINKNKTTMLLLCFVFALLLSGCDIIRDNNFEKSYDYSTVTGKLIEECEEDCIDNEKDILNQLSVMIETLNDYLVENGYATERCDTNQVVERECFESIEQNGWSLYLDHKEYLLGLLEHDYVKVRNGVKTTLLIDPCSGISCPMNVNLYLYMNESVLSIYFFNTVTIFNYSDGFSYETFYADSFSSQENLCSRYEYGNDAHTFYIYCNDEEGEITYKEIELSEGVNTFLRQEPSSGVYYTMSVGDSEMEYLYSQSNDSWFYQIQSKDIEVFDREYIRGNGEIGSNSKYFITLNALLIDDWDRVVREDDSSGGIRYYLYNGDQKINNIAGYEFRVYNKGDKLELELSITKIDFNVFAEKIDSELGINGRNSIAGIIIELNEFMKQPESYIDEHDFIYEFDDEYFIEFFMNDDE